MVYLYHRVPNDMSGDILYPLNILKKKIPEVYSREIKKYFGREIVLKLKMPFLNCLWNDVLHFTPVDPHKISKCLEEIGFERKLSRGYKIDSNLLEKEKALIYLYRGKFFDRKDFIPYSQNKLKFLNQVTPLAKKYYLESFKEGKKILLFHKIPHVLYKGSLNVKGIEFIKA